MPGTVGAVIGATLEPSEFDLGGLGGVVLAPGVGAQGGDAASVGRLFGRVRPRDRASERLAVAAGRRA